MSRDWPDHAARRLPAEFDHVGGPTIGHGSQQDSRSGNEQITS